MHFYYTFWFTKKENVAQETKNWPLEVGVGIFGFGHFLGWCFDFCT